MPAQAAGVGQPATVEIGKQNRVVAEVAVEDVGEENSSNRIPSLNRVQWVHRTLQNVVVGRLSAFHHVLEVVFD